MLCSLNVLSVVWPLEEVFRGETSSQLESEHENSPCADYFPVPRFQSSVQGPRGKQRGASG